MFRINIKPVGELTDAEVIREFKTLLPSAARRAEYQAVQRTVRNVRTRITKEVGRDIALKASTIKQSLNARMPTRAQSTPTGEIVVSPRAVALKEYKAHQRRKGVSVKVMRKAGRKIIKGAFIVPGLGGHVFQRVGDKRLPIKKLFGPSVRMNVEKRRPETLAFIKERLRYNLQERMRWEITKARRRR